MNVKQGKLNDVLINTWETMEMIEEQYVTQDAVLRKENSKIVDYINSIPEFERQVFYLYAEYNSYRKVAQETNVGKDYIAKIIKNLKKDIYSMLNIY